MSNIILYTTHCPRCEVLRKKMDAANIHYQLNENVTEMQRLGIEAVPVLKIENQLLSFTEAVKWINER